MANDRVVVVVRPPAAVRLLGRAQLRVLHGIVDIEGHVIIGGPVATKIRPDSCFIHSGFPVGSTHVKPIPLEVPGPSGGTTHLRRTLARLGMDEAWTQLRPLLDQWTAVMMLEKVAGGKWPVGIKCSPKLRGPFRSLGFRLTLDKPSKLRDPWRQQASALASHLNLTYNIGDQQRTARTRPECRAMPRIIVCGRQNTGKSSLLRMLANSLLNFCPEVLYLDCDPGQCEFTPPATVSLTCITEPLLVPYNTLHSLCRAYFLGHVSPASQPDSYCKAIRALVDYARRATPKVPLLVNTMGWVNGKSRLGLSLLVDVIRWLRPTDLVQLVPNEDSSDTPLPLLDDTLLQSACGWMTSRNSTDSLRPFEDISFHALPGSSYRGRSWARAKREAMVLAYLGCNSGADGYQTSETPYWLWNTTPFRVPWSAVAVHDCDNSVPKKDLLYSIRGSVVALCVVPTDKLLKTENPAYPMFINSCGPYECLGYGLVRAIDPSEHLFYITTPESAERLADVNALVRGDIHLPESLLTAQPLSVFSSVSVKNVALTFCFAFFTPCQTQLLQCGWAPYLAKASSEPVLKSDEEESSDDGSCS
ncbi:hypothetical protein HPB50_025208 [Hyalomma asiaticum]|uniref:Uncharacterized protein n=1 Tax=Hyalomma asiaticum TaxID=266040 RepID=A0ACB7S5L1_HYAAI|nr:hypothetical protein HPB50_025208 [Hyalomma asiaticum]